MKNKIFLLVIFFLLQHTAQASKYISGDEAGNGSIQKNFSVQMIETPQMELIKNYLKASSLPQNILVELEDEILNSHYLKADKNILHQGREFPGDWITDGKASYYYAKTLPVPNGVTTLFPVFFEQDEKTQVKILFHEAFHRLRNIRPNNTSEELVEHLTDLFINDALATESLKKSHQKKLKTFFMNMQTVKPDAIESFWMGNATFYNDNATENVFLTLKANNLIDSWQLKGYGLELGDTLSPQPERTPFAFAQTMQLHLYTKNYYFIGQAQAPNMPIYGQIFDLNNNEYIGEFRLIPSLDGESTDLTLPSTNGN